MDSSALTWHQNSIPEYSSLWYTIQRVSALNCLTKRTIPIRQRGYVPGGLIYSGTQLIELEQLASLLGEPVSVFAWSSLDEIPPNLLDTFATPTPRVCFACLRQGYHTAFFSIRLLDECPIHRCELVDRCRCGKKFAADLSVVNHQSAGWCTCGNLHLFTRETLRRPNISCDEMRVLDEIIPWVQALKSLVIPTALCKAIARDDLRAIGWFAAGAEALDVPYPRCFKRPITNYRSLSQTMRHDHRLTHAVGTIREFKERYNPWDSQPFWEKSAMNDVFRGMARHVRRHIAPRGTRKVFQFIRAADPISIATQIRDSDGKRNAYTDLLWSICVEPRSADRRWRFRHTRRYFPGELSPLVVENSDFKTQTIAEPERQWIQCHATRLSLSAIWTQAQIETHDAIDSGVAHWRADYLTYSSASWQICAWLARVTAEKAELVSICRTILSPLSRNEKSTRRAAHNDRFDARTELIFDTLRGPCLTWSETTGWIVTGKADPVDRDIRRRRLLGVEGARVWCWLYRSEGGDFIARLVEHRIEARGETAQQAIRALRLFTQKYQRTYQNLPPSQPVPVTVERVDTEVLANYRDLVSDVRRWFRFWESAAAMEIAARHCLQNRN